jgi:hypothetical protein
MTEVWYTANQPLFFPPIHMVERFARCHAVVVLQEAQWHRKGGHTRTELMGPNGPFCVSLPVRDKGQRPLDQMFVVPGWSNDLLRTLRGNYRKGIGWSCLSDGLRTLLTALDSQETRVCDIGEGIIRWLGHVLGLGYTVHRSRDLVPERPGEPTAWMASFAPHLRATDYVQGQISIAAYFAPGAFRAQGCRLWSQQYSVPYQPPVISILDPLLRYGPAMVRELIKAAAGPGAAVGTTRHMPAYE